ncbi:hypothetical protein PACTADRAFT_33358 [Pachysolen tannophilus NRRL Y-2460]|uniref:Inositol oxygenase n=1 Tax=Pachysolen tannophilus NRRL Y-2460 TaxID=669874 RepID=A0A1E4TWS0_PACTA|nr:hypothetical protein PACTADRAFT_33358 [Pachysolen tannophilus NRRL Y-2460]
MSGMTKPTISSLIHKENTDSPRISKRVGENHGKLQSSLSSVLQNKDKGYLMERLDEDIQTINLLKSELKKKQKEISSKEKDLKKLQKLIRKREDEGEKIVVEEPQWMSSVNSKLYDDIDIKTYRQYELAKDKVAAFYKTQHEKQTVEYNIQARINFKTKIRDRMTIWEALEKLNKLIDESDPDTELSQIDHAIQTAEAIRRDNKPRWFQLVGLIHDLGKLLYFYDSKGQWDVVGDTFPVGCKFSKKIIFYDYFKRNPDFKNPIYNLKYGIYSANCGLDNVLISWGHDEYFFSICKNSSTLPPEALAMIRYHSCYPLHTELEYQYLMNDHDKQMLKAVQAFNPYDLYSKTDVTYNIEELKPYYLELIDEFFPSKIVDF